MKTSVFIFLFLLVSSLSSVMDSGAKSGVPAAAAVRQTAECFLAGFKYGDCVATETVRTAVPCPVRSLRKPVEGPQRVSGGDRDVCSGRHFPLAQGCCTKYGAAALVYVCTPKTSANISGTLFTVVCSERTALGGVDSDGAQKVLQRLLVGGAADVQLL